MPLVELFGYISMFFWIFPAARQFKSPLFFFFLTLGFFEPLQVILLSFNIAIHFRIIFAILLLNSALYSENNKKFMKIFLPFSIILVAADYLLFTIPGTYYVLASHFVIIYLFFKRTITSVANSGKLNIFHLMLLLEEFSTVFKIILMFQDAKTGIVLFTLTSIFQYLIVLFFTIYR
ncbi:MAG: hypothetical protein WC061_08755, partial [Melioribacteraceae bacterium]